MNTVPLQPAAALVTLDVPPALEERVIDWLLDRGEQARFTSAAAHGYGERHDHLSVAEQVSGRQRRLCFDIEVSMDALDSFIGELSVAFATADLHYRVMPLLRSGHLGT